MIGSGTALIAAGCMLIPQPVEMRAKVYRDFMAGCASNATRQEYGRDSTAGMVVTSTKDQDGNWIALKCDFPHPKPKPPFRPNSTFASFGLEMNFCRNVDGIAQPVKP